MQLILSAVLGATLMGAGLFMRRYDSKYSSYLSATGIVVLFLTTLAAHLYHPILFFQETLAGITVVAGFSVFLYWKLKEEIFALVSIAGAYFVPIVMNIFAPSLTIILYYSFCTAAFVWMGLVYRSKAIWLLLSYASVLSTAIVGAKLPIIDFSIIIALGVQFALCMSGLFVYVKKHNVSLSSANIFGYFILILTYTAQTTSWVAVLKPSLLPWMGIIFAAISALSLFIVKHTIKDSKNIQSLLLTVTLLGIVYSALNNLLPSNLEVWFLPIMILGYILSRKFLPHAMVDEENHFAIPIFILYSIFIINYSFLIIHNANPSFSFNSLSAMLISSILLWCIILLRQILPPLSLNYQSILLGLTHLLTIKTLYHSVENFGSIAVSTIWLAYSIAVLVLGFAKHDKSIARSSMLILIFAAGKALLYDAYQAPSIIRIICLLTTGVVLFGAGYMMRKIATWQSES